MQNAAYGSNQTGEGKDLGKWWGLYLSYASRGTTTVLAWLLYRG
jgi:hypothetical protein